MEILENYKYVLHNHLFLLLTCIGNPILGPLSDVQWPSRCTIIILVF